MGSWWEAVLATREQKFKYFLLSIHKTCWADDARTREQPFREISLFIVVHKRMFQRHENRKTFKWPSFLFFSSSYYDYEFIHETKKCINLPKNSPNWLKWAKISHSLAWKKYTTAILSLHLVYKCIRKSCPDNKWNFFSRHPHSHVGKSDPTTQLSNRICSFRYKIQNEYSKRLCFCVWWDQFTNVLDTK